MFMYMTSYQRELEKIGYTPEWELYCNNYGGTHMVERRFASDKPASEYVDTKDLPIYATPEREICSYKVKMVKKTKNKQAPN